MSTSDDDASVAESYIIFTGITAAGRKVRPSNWTSRLDDIASAHWQARSGHPPCRPCARCPENHCCYAIDGRLFLEEPDLAKDLIFAARMIGAPELGHDCPRGHVRSAEEIEAAAREYTDSHPEAA